MVSEHDWPDCPQTTECSLLELDEAAFVSCARLRENVEYGVLTFLDFNLSSLYRLEGLESLLASATSLSEERTDAFGDSAHSGEVPQRF